jgi:hypothetical protein
MRVKSQSSPTRRNVYEQLHVLMGVLLAASRVTTVFNLLHAFVRWS